MGDDSVLMAHSSSVSLHRSGADPSGPKQAHSVAASRSSSSQAQRPPAHANSPRKDAGAGRKTPGKQARQAHKGRQNNSDQRSQAGDETAASPTKKQSRSARKQQRKVFLLTRDGSDNEKLSPLGDGAAAPKKRSRNRRQQQSPPAGEQTPPRRGSRQQRPQSTPGAQPVVAPTPTMAHHASLPAVGNTPARNGSPSGRHVHYAGASFNNSPAASTLPLPPSFLATPTKTSRALSPVSMRTVVRDEDVFGVAPHDSRLSPPAFMPVAGALHERSRQLDAMLGAPPPQLQQSQLHQFQFPQYQQYQHPLHSHSAVDLAQPTDMTAMLQKLRLVMDMNERPATAAPAPAPRNPHLTPVYNA
ncbi:hypothetical protein H4S02_010657 [Coemansia sp. RSA 2611]|nr:hypothetical protein H4S02_010657 [Coemansia sp. RSA 2611]